MCTLAISAGQNPDWPLVVAANRDEALDRPSTPPVLWRGAPAFMAPRDERAGGTWLGLNAAGLFVGITNRFAAEKYEDRESRGALVVEALRHPSLESLHEALGAMDARRFNAFHLLYSDGRTVGITWSDGDRLTQERQGPGLYVISERSFGAADAPRVERVRAGWPSPQGDGPPEVSKLQELLAQHDGADPLAAPCVHVPAFNYGTRSSLILLLARDRARSQGLWSEGAPCRTRFEPIDELVRALFNRATTSDPL
ncbi:MAG: NRDE family protein [Myxococcaceae bacterium]